MAEKKRNPPSSTAASASESMHSTVSADDWRFLRIRLEKKYEAFCRAEGDAKRHEERALDYLDFIWENKELCGEFCRRAEYRAQLADDVEFVQQLSRLATHCEKGITLILDKAEPEKLDARRRMEDGCFLKTIRERLEDRLRVVNDLRKQIGQGDVEPGKTKNKDLNPWEAIEDRTWNDAVHTVVTLAILAGVYRDTEVGEALSEAQEAETAVRKEWCDNWRRLKCDAMESLFFAYVFYQKYGNWDWHSEDTVGSCFEDTHRALMEWIDEKIVETGAVEAEEPPGGRGGDEDKERQGTESLDVRQGVEVMSKRDSSSRQLSGEQWPDVLHRLDQKAAKVRLSKGSSRPDAFYEKLVEYLDFVHTVSELRQEFHARAEYRGRLLEDSAFIEKVREIPKLFRALLEPIREERRHHVSKRANEFDKSLKRIEEGAGVVERWDFKKHYGDKEGLSWWIQEAYRVVRLLNDIAIEYDFDPVMISPLDVFDVTDQAGECLGYLLRRWEDEWGKMGRIAMWKLWCIHEERGLPARFVSDVYKYEWDFERDTIYNDFEEVHLELREWIEEGAKAAVERAEAELKEKVISTFKETVEQVQSKMSKVLAGRMEEAAGKAEGQMGKRGVSLRQLAMVLEDDNEDAAGKTLAYCRRHRLYKNKPTPIGQHPAHSQTNLYDAKELVEWYCLIEGWDKKRKESYIRTLIRTLEGRATEPRSPE